MMLGQPAQQMAAQQQTAALQQAIPDAPKPQGLPVRAVTPGIGTTSDSNSNTDEKTAAASVPTAAQQAADQKADQGPPVNEPPPGEGVAAFTLRVQTNFVEVPFTVKDNKGRLVAGIHPNEVTVYENGYRQHLDRFTSDPFPLSAALVIDQSLTPDVMAQVNNSLTAVQAAFAAYDEVAVFTYNNGPRMITDFTAGPSARLTQALQHSKSTGREALQMQGGPMACTTCLNGYNVDPNTAAVRNSPGITLNTPREPHTLNDAIFEAAKLLAKVPLGRRRVIYVISDGKEYGSTAKYAEVRKFLQQNKIAVYGTLVGDSAIPVLGFLDKIHVPLMMRDNILHNYVVDTGGDYDGEYRQRGIESSFAKIASEARAQYTLGYYTHEPFIDGKFRTLEIIIGRPNVQISVKKGYYPTATDVRPTVIKAQ